MWRFAFPLALVGSLSVGCAPSLSLDGLDGVQLICEATEDCPTGFTCQTAVSRCVPTSQPDNIAPSLVAAVAQSENIVELTFSEPIVVDDSLNEITIESLVVESIAALGETQIVLTTARQIGGQSYTATVARLVDRSGNLIDPMADSQTFVGFGIVPDTTPPALISPRPFEVVRGVEATLSWSGRLGAQEYEVQVSTTSDFSAQITGSPFTVDTGETALNITALPAETTIYWRVRSDVTLPAAGMTDPWSAVTPQSFETLGDTVHIFCDPAEDCGPQDAVVPTQDRVESGNLATPYRNISRAIAAASNLSIDTVHVARRGGGAYYEEAITLLPGVSVLGGFDSTFQSRDIMQPSRIRSTGVVATASSIIANSISNTTLIEGLRLEGIDSSSQDFSIALAVNSSDGALTIRSCELLGGDALIRSVGLDVTNARSGSMPTLEDSQVESNDASESFGIAIQQGALLAMGNTIVSTGGSTSTTAGLAAFSPQSTVLQSNTVTVDSGRQCRGVWVDATGTANLGRVDLLGNDIRVGTASDGSHGVWYESRQDAAAIGPGMLIFANRISTTQGFRAHVMELRSYRDPIIVQNNLLEGAPVGRNFGASYVLHLNGATDAVFTHNTIVAGDCSTTCAYYGAFIEEPPQNPAISAAAAPTFTNNIFVMRKANQTLFFESGTDGAPRSIENNVMLLNGGSVFSSTESGSVSFAELGIVDVGDPCVGWIEFNGMCNSFFGDARESIRIGGNLSSASALNAFFEDPDGPDNDFATFDDNDWRPLETLSSSIRSGGKDTSSSTCGTIESPTSCGNITTDLNGGPRDMAPTPGAFEVP